MELRIFTEPQQGATYDDLLRIATTAEELAFGAFFRSDHYLAMGTDGLPGPTDAWITLAGLARDTSTIRLGTLMTSATFRLPGPLAIAVAGVDQMSGGRVELGIGAGWYEDEHTAYGIPFPATGERFDRLEESLAVIHGLWSTPEGETFDHEGRYYPVQGSPALAKPVQSPHLPLLIGGKGKKRTPALAATYGDEFNVPFDGVGFSREQFERVRDACAAADRAPDSMIYSNALVLCCGADDAEVRRRADSIGRSVDSLGDAGTLAGTPAQVVDLLGQYADAGASRAYLQVLDLTDMEHLELVAAEVMPQV